MTRKDQSQYGTGVYLDRKRKKKPFAVMVNASGKQRLLGRYETAELAREARRHFLEDSPRNEAQE